MSRPEIAVIGERDLSKRAHAGIEASLALFRQNSEPDLTFRWMPTNILTTEATGEILKTATGIWCAPGSPYADTEGALRAIRHAREQRIAFLGTCGGFQHALMEFSQNVLGYSAAHQELDAAAVDPLIVQLSCSLVGAKAKIVTTPGSRFAGILDGAETVEEFNCNYGLAPTFVPLFAGSKLEFVAHDEAGQVRAFHLTTHPFFVGTLYQPERRALTGNLHPLVRAFLGQACKRPAPL
jgi:CTP synthase (UTP-ammonia lyase)